jgi:ribosomal protein L30E
MNSSRNIIAVLVLTAIAGAASAQGLSRAQVEAELATAIRNGDMVQSSGVTLREMFPGMYPARPPVAHASRAQVESELQAALRNGDVVLGGESGVRAKDLNPSRYPADPVVAGKTREQVRSELAMAIRDGDMPAYGEAGVTRYEMNPALYAHQRAIDAEMQLAQHSGAQAGDGGAVSGPH